MFNVSWTPSQITFIQFLKVIKSNFNIHPNISTSQELERSFFKSERRGGNSNSKQTRSSSNHTMISDNTLMTISNSLGVLAAVFIIIYQFFEVNARRTAELERASYAKLD
ncbi:uncharacterized protein MELLADRAFT_94996 [Melampsora larici-populina 98AG31]|uniref:Uncharacterized protein n=1 Tax=Melampsora larici-populina (strain 98AG31 / pathotype 3-4-7) TaxID=747676 RepID=F4S8R6_MELLP|nr:uncharacterized protein MELLADRAFT_94996 [Melampsora larici-populina 98AG31]EGF98942.1 hypothetical protein MELLADRAFT_94996 [Melampsora larici-populina 98AG31]